MHAEFPSGTVPVTPRPPPIRTERGTEYAVFAQVTAA
jgi:hypothetical protein